MLDSNRTSQHGFTVVELLVAISLLGLIGVTFLAVITNYFVVIDRNNKLTSMTISSQNLLRSTVNNIRIGGGVRQNSGISDPNAPAGGWNTSNSIFVVVLAVPAENASREYIMNPATGSPYMNELVYYRDGTRLMERKLAHPSATGNRMRTTCPEAVATSSCPPDILLAEHVKTLTFTLYDQDTNQTLSTSAARSIRIDLEMERNAPNQPINVSNSIRVSLRNRF